MKVRWYKLLNLKYIFKIAYNGNIVIMLNFVTLLHKDCLKHDIPTNGDTPKLKMEIFK